MKNSPSKTQDVSAYSEYDQITHVLKRTDAYLGSDVFETRQEYILQYRDTPMTMAMADIVVSEAMIRTFIEILSNAGDNVFRSMEVKDLDLGAIRVWFKDNKITVQNNGLCIPIQKRNKNDTMYISEKIFGQLLTSSNYDESIPRMGCGRNGYGAKLTNVMSQEFTVEIRNPESKSMSIQTWTDNMRTKGPHVLSKYSGSESSVTVSYILDFAHFGVKGYPDNVEELFARYTGDFALSCKIPVYFNDVLIPFYDIEKYGKIALGLETDEFATFSAKKGYNHSMPLSSYELLIAYVPDEGSVFSFVNGMMTTNGGVHVNAVFKVLSKHIIEHFKDMDVKLSVTDISPHFSMILNTHLPNPIFSSQTKTFMSGPTPAIDLPLYLLKRIASWGIIERIGSTVEAKLKRKSKLTDGKKKKRVDISKGTDANEAGGACSHLCTLDIVEGDSADGYMETMRGMVDKGHDYIGSYPLTGKFLNCTIAEGKPYCEQLHTNREYCDLKKMIGLKDGEDYSIIENREELRYGTIRFRTDADGDGKHIAGLLLTLFGLQYHELIRAGMIEMAYTPIKRAFKGKSRKSFLTESEYDKWKEHTPDWKSWSIKYFKGLGTSTRDDIMDDIKSPCNVKFRWIDEESRNSILLAFSKMKIKERKQWMVSAKNRISVIDPDQIITAKDLRGKNSQTVTDFIDNELIFFPFMSLVRAIPGIDGLKESQRKLLWAGMAKWSTDNKPDRGYLRTMHEMKVMQFGAYASEFTLFHHNEQLMGETLRSMAMSFVGSNNLPYFKAIGQFGTRKQGGKDAADSRYLNTCLEWWIPYVFMSEDVPFLTLRIDEGQRVEPEVLLPIIPMSLVNGSLGIATGWSTFIPKHNPLDIIDYLIAKLDSTEPKPFKPWYRGFRGKITVLEGAKSTMNLPENLLPENEDNNEDVVDVRCSNFISRGTNRVLVTDGVYRTSNKNNDIMIDELPVGMWTAKYMAYLDELIKKKSIEGYAQTSTEGRASFILQNARSLKSQQLRLRRCYGLNNMVLLSEGNFPVIYKNSTAIIDAFYKWRLPFYKQRKEWYTKDFESKLLKFKEKQKIILLIMDKKVEIFRRNEEDIIADFKRNGILSPELWSTISLSQFTVAHLTKLKDQETEISTHLEYYRLMTPKDLWKRDLVAFTEEYKKRMAKQ